MSSNAVRDMIAVLEQEADALRTGNLDALPAIAEAKVQLSTALHQSKSTSQELEILRAKASANASLLAAAIRGIKTAQTRLAAMSEVRDVLSVYGQNGQLERVPTQRSDVERKA